MTKFYSKPITDLFSIDVDHLVRESICEGFRFLQKLVNDYRNGINRFNKYGESLYGLFTKEGVLIAIGGLNKDPYSNDPEIGRLRRFYVSKAYRRKGLGKLLLGKIISDARKYYKILVLNTETEQADRFYTSLGFSKETTFPKSTHFLKL
ncbi:TPA: GNAT family N-acetyltransferase [Bacillus tropicus]|nr:GNAT family N-acetyltransferase [Bacillus tropicus]